MDGGGVGGGTTLSELYQSGKKLQLKIRDGLERLERLESSTSSSSLSTSSSLSSSGYYSSASSAALASTPSPLANEIERDLIQLKALCVDMDRLWRSVAVKSQRDLWRRKVEQVSEEADSLKESLDKYFTRNQRRMQEAREREELFGRANGESSHVLRIFDDEAQAMQSARNSARMLEEAYANGVAILSKFGEQRERMKGAQRKVLDVLNTVGLSNSVLRLIERRNRVDTWIKYAGMLLTFIVLIVVWRWKH